jgi:hypothetical protein
MLAVPRATRPKNAVRTAKGNRASSNVRPEKMNKKMTYTEVMKYLKTYSTEEPPYDFNGLLHLVLEGVDNLRANAIDADFEDYAASISDEQAAFIQKLLDSRADSAGKYEKET